MPYTHPSKEDGFTNIAYIRGRVGQHVGDVCIAEIDFAYLFQYFYAIRFFAKQVDESGLFQVEQIVGQCVPADFQVAFQFGIIRLEWYALGKGIKQFFVFMYFINKKFFPALCVKLVG